MMFNHLNTILGVRGIPLCYIVRANPNPQFDYYDTFDMQLIKLAPLTGDGYRYDAAAVHNIIIGKTGQEVASFLRTNQIVNDGRADMQALFNVYTGFGNREARLAQAEATRTSLFYRDEKLMPFTRFLHSAQMMFEILYENGQGLNEYQKCQFILDKCAGCPYLVEQINSCTIRQHDQNLQYAYIISLFTSTIFKHQITIKSNRTSDNKVSETITATNISATAVTKAEAEKQYNNTEWYSIDWKKRKAILTYRKENNIPNTPRNGTGSGSKVITRSRSRKLAETDTAQNTDLDLSVEEAAILTRVVKRLATEPAAETATNTSTISSVAGNSFGGRHEAASSKPSHLSPVSSSGRRMISRVQYKPTSPDSTIVGNIELDSHADTCVLGQNFIVLNYTSRVTDVYGYSKELGAITDIPIVTGATAVDHPVTGETMILVVNEALWYGSRLDHSLLNPNQLRHYGCVVHDNPYDTENPLSISYGTNTLVDLQTKGTLIYGVTRTPTAYELEHCPRHVITSDNVWSPHDVQMSALETDPTQHIDPYTAAYIFCELDQTINDDFRILGDSSTLLDERLICCADSDTSRLIAGVDSVKNDLPFPHTFISTKRHTDVSPEELANRWMIGLQQAKETLAATTQFYVRSAILPLARRYRTDRYFYRNRLTGTFAADLYHGRSISGRGNKYCFIVAHPNGFCAAFPQKTRYSNETTDSLKLFTREWGIPEKLVVDGGSELVGPNTSFMKQIKYYDIKLHVSETRTPQQNPAEGIIREIRKKWNRIKNHRNVHERLWDYGVIWVCEILRHTVSFSRYADRRTPIEIVAGDTPDISEYLDFSIYDWVIFKQNVIIGDTSYGRFLGVSHTFGNLMTYLIINENGKVMSRSTVQRITNLELQQEETKIKCAAFMIKLNNYLGDPDAHIITDPNPDEHYIELNNEEQKEIIKSMGDISIDQVPGDPDSFTADSVDPLINSQIKLSRGTDNTYDIGKVSKRLKDVHGNPIGKRDDNPDLDTRLYDVTWSDGSTEPLFANTITQNLYDISQDPSHN